MKKPYSFLSNSEELRTTRAAVRKGFIEQALEKSRLSQPFLDQARELKRLASSKLTIEELWQEPHLRPMLLAVAGLSAKAQQHLTEDDKVSAVMQLSEEFLSPEGNVSPEDLAFRMLLIRGDTLGGQMRNLGGRLGKRRINCGLVEALKKDGRELLWCSGNSFNWSKYDGPNSCYGSEEIIKAMQWNTAGMKRTLFHDIKNPISNTNVDLCLFSTHLDNLKRNAQSPLCDAASYVALGEVKSGIDPAGADEHWKTADSALARIRKGFAKAGKRPHTFFVGAAIERKMAEEIYEQLREGKLSFAANLTKDDHLRKLCKWLISI